MSLISPLTGRDTASVSPEITGGHDWFTPVHSQSVMPESAWHQLREMTPVGEMAAWKSIWKHLKTR